MHEFTTAQSILSTVLRVAAENEAEEVTEIALEISALSHLNRGQLAFCLKALAEKSMAENAKIRITTRSVRALCNGCGYEGPVKARGDPFEALASVKCPRCGGRDLEIEGLNDCIVKHIRIKKRSK
ncbi:MAG: hydrogenase/urease maturation nickel metallochaperone HypA [Candidatus Bathyarchaeia archaeon]|nr:hydrogenase maturation nickel metallochaperone HypA [Candidatus Bathyarchaeota archaeon]